MKQLIHSLAVLTCLGIGASDVAAGAGARVVAGWTHSCALTTTGGVACWGSNAYGQLGDGTTATQSTPASVTGLGTGVEAIAAGFYHTCALTASGGVVCWGANSWGQIGDGTTTTRKTPTAVSGLSSGVAAITAGDYQTCALTTGGGVVCWGHNEQGELGDGTTSQRLTPTGVIGLSSGVAAIAGGESHTCALTTGGGVWCWGSDWYGQLGDGRSWVFAQPTPVAVIGLGTGVAAITAGGQNTCAMTTAGGVRCWGWNAYGQLGIGSTEDWRTPKTVSGLESGVAAVATGWRHTCAVTTQGSARCWGWNAYGQLGDGTVTERWTPTPVSGLENGVALTAAGVYHTCAVTTSGSVVCWGRNSQGQLGDGTTAERWTPAAVIGFEGRRSAAADFTGDLKSDILWRHATRGEVWLWPMDGAVRTTETRVGTVADADWEIRGLGDQSGDGKADVLWRHKTTGMIYFWPMNGSTRLAETYVATVDPAYDIVGTGDYNGDGKSDILWRHLTNGEVWIWLMNGATPLSEMYVDTVDPGYVVKGSGDLNEDGKADIVWHHATQGEVWVWLMNGTTKLSQTWVATVPDVGYQIVGVADHAGDRQADILWHHATRGEVWIWTMNGSTRTAETWVGTVPDTGYRIVGSGDYNGDRKADILWHHATRGEVWVWLMNGTTKLSETWVATVPEVGYQIVTVK